MASQSRNTLTQLNANALTAMNAFHSEVVRDVEEAIKANQVVVVGMSGNPFVKKMRSKFERDGIAFKYLEFGSYFTGWKKRLAIKLWSGWPTFPQVFLNGKLLGGYSETIELIQKNEVNFKS